MSVVLNWLPKPRAIALALHWFPIRTDGMHTHSLSMPHLVSVRVLAVGYPHRVVPMYDVVLTALSS